MPAQVQITEAQVQAEIARYGSLDAAISGLSHDADGAPWGAPVHAVLNALFDERSRLRAMGERAPASGGRYINAARVA